MSLPSNAGSCMTCSACGNYTNFYKNSTKTFDVTQYLQDTNSIYVYFHNFTGGYSYKISNLEFTIKTYSKLQFTDTVTPTLKSLGSFNNSLKIVLKTVFTTRISNIISDTGRCEGYCYWEYDVVSLNASILSNPENYAKAVAEFSIYGKADDGFKFYLNGTNITTFASVCNHGSCTSKSDWIPSLHSFEYSLTSKTNNLLIKAYSIKNDYLAEIYSAILTIKTESKQFTNSISPSVNSLGTLNKTLKVVLKHVFSKSVANVNTEPVNCGLGCYWEYDVISIKIDLPDEVSNYSKIDSFFKLYGMADNGFKFYLNNSLLKTVESICPSMCHIQSNWSPSNYNFSFPVTSKNNTLLIKAYSDQMIYWAKIYSASVSIETTSKQFTDTINTVNPDCNVKAETKYQSVNITLPFNLVISPQDRWCEIHLSRVDYITTVSGGFPNTAVRVDFTSSSGHDPNYSNLIMYFDANGNLTFSNFCTQQSHSGSVDTWNITYMGKHYHFTIHWYW